MKRKLIASALALCSLCSLAIPALAKTVYRNGTYNGLGYGTTDTCELKSFYSETGSASDYTVHTKVVFYYNLINGDGVYIGRVSSGYDKNKAEVSGKDPGYEYNRIIGTHYVNGSIVETVTVYS